MTLVARRALSRQLWQDGMLPEGGGLQVRDVSDTELAEALHEDAR